MTNAASGNQVQVYTQDANGILSAAAATPTGGTGTGLGLENQSALAVSGDRRFLFVVNPGSDELSAFRIDPLNLTLTDRMPSGGKLPISVAEWNGSVFVLNRHASSDPGSGPAVRGFRVSAAGKLNPIPGSELTLSQTNTNAAQIAVSPDGMWMVVTERATSEIDVVPLSEDGAPGEPVTTTSSGSGPFGFAFSDAGRLYVSEAGAGTTSAYEIDARGSLKTISAALPTQQRATCWLAITHDNRFIYVANTTSNTVSLYSLAADGSLQQPIPVAATTSAGALDLLVDPNDTYLSVLTTDGSIESFRIDPVSGSLSFIQSVPGLPAGTNGLAGV